MPYTCVHIEYTTAGTPPIAADSLRASCGGSLRSYLLLLLFFLNWINKQINRSDNDLVEWVSFFLRYLFTYFQFSDCKYRAQKRALVPTARRGDSLTYSLCWQPNEAQNWLRRQREQSRSGELTVPRVAIRPFEGGQRALNRGRGAAFYF